LPRYRNRIALLLLPLMLPGLVSAETAGTIAPAAADPRSVYLEGHSPAWLRAVGKLIVPGIRYENGYRRHHTERCSATLVNTSTNARADTIVTAWHCLEFYEDLSQQIIFILETASGERIQTQATRLAEGGHMEADWAIMRLRQAVSGEQVPALAMNPGRANPRQSLLMAGYSRDSGRGQSGASLSYDPACFITGQTSTHSDSNCTAYKGASGGAVIQLSTAGEPLLSGVISQGNGGNVSRFIPLSRFRQTLLTQLR